MDFSFLLYIIYVAAKQQLILHPSPSSDGCHRLSPPFAIAQIEWQDVSVASLQLGEQGSFRVFVIAQHLGWSYLVRQGGKQISVPAITGI